LVVFPLKPYSWLAETKKVLTLNQKVENCKTLRHVKHLAFPQLVESFPQTTYLLDLRIGTHKIQMSPDQVLFFHCFGVPPQKQWKVEQVKQHASRATQHS
jgi:hypothetical protein